MGDRRNVRILQGRQDPLRDPLARLVLPEVDTGHDPIGLGQDVVGQVQPAVLQDVDLDSLENREALEPAIEPVDLRPLRKQAVGVQPVGHRRPLRMVGDREVLQTALAAASTISSIVARPSVQVVCMWRSPRRSRRSISSGKPLLGRPLEFAPGLAQLRRNPGKVHRRVDLLLVRPATRFSPRKRRIR